MSQVFKNPFGDEIQLVAAQVQLLQVWQTKCVQLSDEVIGQVESSKPYIQIQWDRIKVLVAAAPLLKMKATLIIIGEINHGNRQISKQITLYLFDKDTSNEMPMTFLVSICSSYLWVMAWQSIYINPLLEKPE